MAEFRMILDVALGTPESRVVVPQLATGCAAQPAICDAVRVSAGVGIQISAGKGEWEAGPKCGDAARLPAAQNRPDQTSGVPEDRHLPHVVDYCIVRHIKTVAPAICAAVTRILIDRVHATGRVVAAIAFPQRLAECVGQTRGEPVRVALLRLNLQRVIT